MPQAVSSRYAKALADTVLDPAVQLNPDAVRNELAAFEALTRESEQLREVLLSPAVSPGRKRAVAGRFATMLPLSKIVRNFLYVLIDRRRIGQLREIREAFEAELDARLGVVRAAVATAAPLAATEQSELEAALSRVTGKQVRAEFSVDPALIGGAVARIGSTIYDGSVRGQLDALRSRLVSQA